MLLRPFAERIRAPRAWTWIAFRAGRWPVALMLALAPALLVLAFSLAIPDLGATMTDPARVREAMARYISGLMTAATMAVGFAALAMGRGIKGIGEIGEHVKADQEFAARVRRLTGENEAPMAVGPLLARVLRKVAAKARAVERPEARAFAAELSDHARAVAERVEAAGPRPDALLAAALDLDAETALHEARLLGLADLAEPLEVADIARSYAKTLATQWSLSRMSQGIAASSFVAVAASTALVLAYGAIPFAWAVAVVAGALVVALLPLAVFVSFVLRSVFVTQHTLAIGHFVLGPENDRALRGSRRAS